MNPSETLAPPRTEVRIGALNAEEIAAISKRVKEPEFLARRRAAAWAHCEKTPFPPRTEELWRRTDISSLKWDGILAAQLDYRTRPCNFVEIMPRLDEHLRRPKAQGASV